MSIIVLKSSVSEFQPLAAKYFMDINPYLVVFGLDKGNIFWPLSMYLDVLTLRAVVCNSQVRRVKWKNSKSFKLCQNVGLYEVLMLWKFYFDRINIKGERRLNWFSQATFGF
jgi:hypothetical protein